jgi:hypothetical protein
LLRKRDSPEKSGLLQKENYKSLRTLQHHGAQTASPALSGFTYFCYGEVYSEESDTMSNPQQPNVRLVNSPDYRDSYANSIQVRVSVWDFLLVFGRLQPLNAQDVEVQNFQGIYLSPQQAKALLTVLEQNVRQYEGTFGEIKLDPSIAAQGQVN